MADLLLEDGSSLLLETGDSLLLEEVIPGPDTSDKRMAVASIPLFAPALAADSTISVFDRGHVAGSYRYDFYASSLIEEEEEEGAEHMGVGVLSGSEVHSSRTVIGTPIG